MKLTKCHMAAIALVGLLGLAACSGKNAKTEADKTPGASAAASTLSKKNEIPPQMPTRYQNPGYMASKESNLGDSLDSEAEAYKIKVGATVKSTTGPQPLWDVLKRLATLKGMTVSWANDVDQNFLVDVDIHKDDNFLDAVGNLLRQADYFYEVKDRAIIVKNKTTEIFQIGVPAMKGTYSSSVGGNYLASAKDSNGTEGIAKVSSKENEFDIWGNVKSNLDVILGVGSQDPNKDNKSTTDPLNGEGNSKTATVVVQTSGKGDLKSSEEANKKATVTVESQRSKDGAFYIIDPSVGTITVTAKPSAMQTVRDYINNFKKQLYQQIEIEAKIIEVYLADRTKIGLDWGSILEDLSVSGVVDFGSNGQVYPWIPTSDDSVSETRFVSKVSINSLDFSVLINALDEQGDAQVLSNPKLTVLNGQPAVISVGKHHTYISDLSAEWDDSSNGSSSYPRITYTTNVDTVVEGVSFGVMANIIEGSKIIMQLTPITTELENGEIAYEVIDQTTGAKVGLPVLNVREMSTTVEVNDGEMLIIGGLIDSVQQNDSQFVPLVGKIPILKYLFGYEEKQLRKRELVILLAPKIL